MTTTVCGCVVGFLSLERRMVTVFRSSCSWSSLATTCVRAGNYLVDVPLRPPSLFTLKLHGTIRVPLYITQQRRNAMGVGMMMEADLDTREHPSHWVLQGVALVLNTDT